MIQRGLQLSRTDPSLLRTAHCLTMNTCETAMRGYKVRSTCLRISLRTELTGDKALGQLNLVIRRSGPQTGLASKDSTRNLLTQRDMVHQKLDQAIKKLSMQAL